VATFLERIWKRHSNPWSVWTRILSYPLVYVPIWNRSWKQGAAVAAWFAANPLIFPAPEGDESWATRGVLGEELWTAERPRDLSMLINTASAAFFAGGSSPPTGGGLGRWCSSRAWLSCSSSGTSTG
jgi:hypothetical protein